MKDTTRFFSHPENTESSKNTRRQPSELHGESKLSHILVDISLRSGMVHLRYYVKQESGHEITNELMNAGLIDEEVSTELLDNAIDIGRDYSMRTIIGPVEINNLINYFINNKNGYIDVTHAENASIIEELKDFQSEVIAPLLPTKSNYWTKT